MPSNGIIPSDLFDAGFIDARELASDGYDVYLTVPLVSITSGIITVTINNSVTFGLITDEDNPVELDDRVFIFGATPPSVDGYYTVSNLLTDSTFEVLESISNATGGSVSFIHPAGASKVGIDNTTLSNVTSNNVQGALEELDIAISTGGITENEHEDLDTLVHNISETSFEEGTYTGPFNRLSNVTIYTDATKTTKVREVNFTYTGSRVTTVQTIQYDSSGNVKDTLTETIAYTGPFTNRIDTITRVKT